jgi:hypothetical protein
MTFNNLTLEQRKEHKQCGLCCMVKHLDEFYKNNCGVRGRHKNCKVCMKGLYEKDRESILEFKRLKYKHQKIHGIP